MSKDDSFIFRTKYRPQLMDLEPEQQGKILMACIDFVLYGYAPELDDPAANMLLMIILGDIKADKERYEQICEKRRQNVSKRYKSIQVNTNDTNVYKSYRYDNDNDSDNDSDHDMNNKSIYNSDPIIHSADKARSSSLSSSLPTYDIKKIRDDTLLKLKMGGAS